MLLKAQDIKDMLMFCLINILLSIKWREIRVQCIELELLMFVKLHCLVLMTKGIFLMMALIVWLIFMKM